MSKSTSSEPDDPDSDPDDPFFPDGGRDEGALPYGEGGQELNFTSGSGALSRVFSLTDVDNRDRKPEQLSGDLSRKRKIR